MPILAPVQDQESAITASREHATELPDRRKRLLAQHQMADRLLDAFEQWLDEVEELLGGN